jgi:DNA-damage-inducible protein J
MKTQTTIRVEDSTYQQAKEILSQIGMTYSQAISVFNSMIVLNRGIPFDLKLPSTDTEIALEKTENVDEISTDFKRK